MLDAHHERTRRRGVFALVYWPVRFVLKPALLGWFRLRRLGREHIPDGGVILAANHRSFLDPFIIGACLPRPIYFVAKQELFETPWGWWSTASFLPGEAGRVGRGEHRVTSVGCSPRERPWSSSPRAPASGQGHSGRPKRGVGRLALETGAPVVPIALTGTERARRWLPPSGPSRSRRPLRTPAHLPARGVTVTEPRARGFRAHLALRRAPVGVARRPAAAAHRRRRGRAGSMGTAAAALLARAWASRCSSAAGRPPRPSASPRPREEERYLPGVHLDESILVSTVADIEFAAADLVVFAVPLPEPAGCRGQGGRTPERSQRGAGGLQGPRRPARDHAERLRCRAGSRPGGRLPGRPRRRPREAVEDGRRGRARRPMTLTPRRQLSDALQAAGPAAWRRPTT